MVRRHGGAPDHGRCWGLCSTCDRAIRRRFPPCAGGRGRRRRASPLTGALRTDHPGRTIVGLQASSTGEPLGRSFDAEMLGLVGVAPSSCPSWGCPEIRWTGSPTRRRPRRRSGCRRRPRGRPRPSGGCMGVGVRRSEKWPTLWGPPGSPGARGRRVRPGSVASRGDEPGEVVDGITEAVRRLPEFRRVPPVDGGREERR